MFNWSKCCCHLLRCVLNGVCKKIIISQTRQASTSRHGPSMCLCLVFLNIQCTLHNVIYHIISIALTLIKQHLLVCTQLVYKLAFAMNTISYYMLWFSGSKYTECKTLQPRSCHDGTYEYIWCYVALHQIMLHSVFSYHIVQPVLFWGISCWFEAYILLSIYKWSSSTSSICPPY